MAKRFQPWNQKDFGMRLRIALLMRKHTQSQLAAALGINQGTVSRWQSSRANYPGLDHLEAAAQFLNVEVCWLAFGCPRHIPPEVEDYIAGLGHRRLRLR